MSKKFQFKMKRVIAKVSDIAYDCALNVTVPALILTGLRLVRTYFGSIVPDDSDGLVLYS